MLRQNDWHFKQMPTLTYVAYFDFVTPLDLEQCSQRLLEATKDEPHRGKTHVYEVSRDPNKGILFAAKYAMNQSAWYLAGQIKPAGTQKENHVSCYTGIPIATLIVPLIFLLIVLILVGLANHLSVLAVLLLFAAILITTGLVGIRYVGLFRQGLERDIRVLLSANDIKSG